MHDINLRTIKISPSGRYDKRRIWSLTEQNPRKRIIVDKQQNIEIPPGEKIPLENLPSSAS